ncbi:hypothetical protein [Paraliobacillus salinarum]|uniref:hypothetical protein n=1 Tax=Paraliobacillus salinarum TaxID=1158996 RepID=UPI001FE2C07F|nr:hypothetical protein [Paraliobacillus salinarum]
MAVLCDVLNNGGIVSCYLSNSNGDPIDPCDPASNLCQEIKDHSNEREDVIVTLPSGEEVLLQKVVIQKSGYIVIKVSNGMDTCLSDPIPFNKTENLLLCAPEGTDVECKITAFDCSAIIQCRNNNYRSVEINLDICQSIQSVTDTTIEVDEELCKLREKISAKHCNERSITTNCYHLNQPNQNMLPVVSEEFKDKDCTNREKVCINVPKVYDWVIRQSTITLRKSAEQVPFVCNICSLDLFVSAITVCEGTISGTITCDDEPIEGAIINLSASPNIVSFSPNPTISDAFGNFTSTITVPDGTDPTEVEIIASTMVDDQLLTVSMPTLAQCPIEPCELSLFGPDLIECNNMIAGNVRCGSELIPNVEVTLTANPAFVTFDPNPAYTGENGNYMSAVSIPAGTPPTNVEITASATVNGDLLTTSINVIVSCERDCSLELNADALITCEGIITGSLFCDGMPVEGAFIEFNDFPSVGTFTPNPTITAADGTFSTTLTIPEGTPTLSTTITASTLIDGEIITTSIGVQVECPEVECPCKFRIGVEGGAAPATVNVTRNGVPAILSGTINVTAIQCFTAAPMCNPAVDNFNVAFGNGGNTINFINGRRIEIECDGNTFASVRGTATATGNYLPNGIYEVIITLTIGAGNIGTWTVDATDMHGNTFSTTFAALINPITFIGDCDERP